jgi:hypothetical protein
VCIRVHSHSFAVKNHIQGQARDSEFGALCNGGGILLMTDVTRTMDFAGLTLCQAVRSWDGAIRNLPFGRMPVCGRNIDDIAVDMRELARAKLRRAKK